MARSSSPIAVYFTLTLLLLSLEGSSACLTRKFYLKTCHSLFTTVRPLVYSALSKEPRTGASIVRLFFHDCFVQGCDASLLLDDTANFEGEKTARTNMDSLNPKAFELIDDIREAVEKVCPGVVSCADILTIAARDSVEILGGPSWSVKLGRRDSTTANFSAAETDIPAPFFNLSQLIASFEHKGLSARDMVALSGSHTIGQARCTSFRAHIYNGSNIDSSFAKLRKSNCPAEEGTGDDNLAPLDILTSTVFDNSYFKNLVKSKGLLNSDQELFNGSSTDSLVKTYSHSKPAFFSDFVAGMLRMGNLQPLTGSQGEIRKNCRRIN